MSIEANKIFYSGLYSDYISIEHKDENILYFCTDTKQIFKGTTDVTQEYQQVYDKPDDPTAGILYASSESGTVETYNGTSWVEVFAPIVGTDTVYTVPLAEGETSVTFPMPNEGDVVDIYTDNNAQYTSIEVNEPTRTRSGNNTGSLTVNFAQQEISDNIHMRVYHNDQYTASVLASLCIDSISITHPANTTVFTQGDVFDITGLQVTALYNGETIDITNSITTIPAAGEKLKNTGVNSVRIIYGTLETSYNINVISINEIEVTTLPTKTIYETGESLDLTGIVVTGYANNRTVFKIVTDDCRFVPPNGTVLAEEKTYTIAVSYDNLSTSFDVICQNLPDWDSRGLDYNSWETIQAYTKAGLLGTKVNVGATKTISSSEGNLVMELVAINDGSELPSYYPANTADFLAKTLTSNQYSPGASNWNGWADCDAKTSVNSTFYNSLSQELTQCIVAKSHYYSDPQSSSSSSFKLSVDNIWIPTSYEMYGNYNDNASYSKRYAASSISSGIYPLGSKYGSTGQWYGYNGSSFMSDRIAWRSNFTRNLRLGFRIG